MRELDLFGLNEYEEKTYKALLLLGEAKPYDISKKSGVPFGRIYDVLESLVKKGFIRITMKRPKKYIAEDPEKLLAKPIGEKIKKLSKLKEDIKSWQKLYEKVPEEAVYAVKGKNAFNKIIAEKEEPKEFEYSIKYFFDTHPVWLRKIRNRIKKGVDMKTLGRFDDETKENVEKWLKIEKSIRPFPNKGVAIDIIDGKRVIIGLIKSDITLVITDEAFVEIMKNLFENSWKASKK